MLLRCIALLSALFVLSACSATPASTPATAATPGELPTAVPTATTEQTTPPRPTPQATRPPQPTATPISSPGCRLALTVLPPEEPVEARMAIPGERVVFLVMIEDFYPDQGPIELQVEGIGVTIDQSTVATPANGEIAEIAVDLDESSAEATASVTFTVDSCATEQRSIGVMPWEDTRAQEAGPYLERWVTWLGAEQPELGITAATEWQAEFVKPVLVVSHYAYWNEDWEMVVSWHVMVPPDDFTEVRLRRRGVELAYGLAFRQDSFANDTEPRSIDGGELMR